MAIVVETIDIDKDAIELGVAMVRGDDFTHDFRIGGKEDPEDATEYWDLTGWTLQGEVRPKVSSEVVLATMVITLADQTATPGQFNVLIPAGELLAEDADGGTVNFPIKGCIGDIEFVNPAGLTRTYLRLLFAIDGDSTRVAE